jgi:hypothetical protein
MAHKRAVAGTLNLVEHLLGQMHFAHVRLSTEVNLWSLHVFVFVTRCTLLSFKELCRVADWFLIFVHFFPFFVARAP